MLLYIRVNQKFMGKPYEGPERRSSKREGEIREIDIRGAAARVIRDGHALSDADFTEGPVMESAIRDKLLTTLGSN